VSRTATPSVRATAPASRPCVGGAAMRQLALFFPPVRVRPFRAAVGAAEYVQGDLGGARASLEHALAICESTRGTDFPPALAIGGELARINHGQRAYAVADPGEGVLAQQPGSIKAFRADLPHLGRD
jgi:hypothetical protein